MNKRQKTILYKSQRILLPALAFGILLVGGFEYTKASGIKLAYESQPHLRCLPYEVSIVHRRTVKASAVSQGDLVAIKTTSFEKYFPDTEEILKVVVGKPGDEVSIVEGEVFINGESFGGPSHAEASFGRVGDGTFKLRDNEFFVMGTSPTAVDSRIIGSVNINMIVGTAYAVI